MIALAVIMSDEILIGYPQRLLAEEDHVIQAGLDTIVLLFSISVHLRP